MKTFLTAASAATILSGLPALRAQYTAALSPEERVSTCTALASSYRRLGLLDRAADWLRAALPLIDGTLSDEVLFQYQLTSAWVWLARDEVEAWTHAVVRLKHLSAPPEQELEVLALAVHVSLHAHPPEPFSALERAFRYLRAHPSAAWSSRFLVWRGEWLAGLGREEEALAACKKSVTEAQKSNDLEVELNAWLALATLPFQSKTKSVRAAKTALEKALAGDVPSAVVLANWVLSEAGGAKESQTASAFRAYFDADKALKNRMAQWDRDAHEADEKIFEDAGRDRRRLEAEMLAAITVRLAADSDLSRCLDGIYVPLKALMAADVFGIALAVPEQNSLDYALFLEEGRRTRVGLIPVESSRSLGAWCFREQRAVRINDIDREFALYLKELSKLSEHRPKSMLFQPLTGASGKLGIVTVQSFARDAYGPEAEAQLAVIAACISLRLQAGRSG